MIVRARQLFARERVDTRTRVEAVWLYFQGLSFRAVAAYSDHAFTAEAVRYWWNRMASLFDYVDVKKSRQKSRVIAAHETGILVGKKQEFHNPPHILWAAIDTENLTLVNVKFARFQYNTDRRDFLHEIRHRVAASIPIVLHDRGPWYKKQSEAISIQHHQVARGARSLIECWNRQLKHRIDRFWRAFPPNARPEQVRRWLTIYTVMWNLTRGWDTS